MSLVSHSYGVVLGATRGPEGRRLVPDYLRYSRPYGQHEARAPDEARDVQVPSAQVEQLALMKFGAADAGQGAGAGGDIEQDVLTCVGLIASERQQLWKYLAERNGLQLDDDYVVIASPEGNFVSVRLRDGGRVEEVNPPIEPVFQIARHCAVCAYVGEIGRCRAVRCRSVQPDRSTSVLKIQEDLAGQPLESQDWLTRLRVEVFGEGQVRRGDSGFIGLLGKLGRALFQRQPAEKS